MTASRFCLAKAHISIRRRYPLSVDTRKRSRCSFAELAMAWFGTKYAGRAIFHAYGRVTRRRGLTHRYRVCLIFVWLLVWSMCWKKVSRVRFVIETWKCNRTTKTTVAAWILERFSFYFDIFYRKGRRLIWFLKESNKPMCFIVKFWCSYAMTCKLIIIEHSLLRIFRMLILFVQDGNL